MSRASAVVRIAGVVCSVAAAVLLLVGPLTRWADVRADPQAFAAVLREDVGVVAPAIDESTGDFTWLEADTHGDVGWLAGVAMLVLAIVAVRRATMVGGAASVVIGGGCAWLAVANAPDARVVRAEAVRLVAGWAFAVHVDPQLLTPVFAVTRGPSTSLVVAGAVAAIVGGVLTILAAGNAAPTSWVSWDVLRSRAVIARDAGA